MTEYTVLMEQLGYQFKNVELLQRALTHRSHAGTNNERLEFLGDAVLSLVIAEELFANRPEAREGQLSRLRSTLVNGSTLAKLATAFDFHSYVRLGEGEQKSGGRDRESIKEDVFEAIIGAIYVDSDFTTVRKCVLRWYQHLFENITDVKVIKDPKSELQEWCQARQKPLPLYRVLVTGEAHDQTFDATCMIDGVEFETQGSGSSRRKAEREAANNFLVKLNEK